jgi:hypothetical protein
MYVLKIYSQVAIDFIKTGRSIAQASKRRLLTKKTRAQSRLATSKIHGGRSGTGAGFSPELFGVPLLIIIPSLLHTYLSPSHEVCDSPDQAAHYCNFGPRLGVSSLTQHLVDLGVR